jgi:hypothetical protein
MSDSVPSTGTVADLESSRGRRAFFVYALTVACFAGAFSIAWSGNDTHVASETVRAMLDIISTILWVYLPVSAVDRAGMFHGIAARFNGGNPPQEPPQ